MPGFGSANHLIRGTHLIQRTHKVTPPNLNVTIDGDCNTATLGDMGSKTTFHKGPRRPEEQPWWEELCLTDHSTGADSQHRVEL